MRKIDSQKWGVIIALKRVKKSIDKIKRSAEQIVKEWRESHPDGKKADCIRDTGLSKPTVYKWWSVGEAL